MDRTLPKPLNGAEIRKAISFDLARALELDDRLADHLAFDGFSYKLRVEVSLPSAIQQEFTRDLIGGRGERPAEDTDVVAQEVERPLTPPNAVRMDTDQPVPTLVEENGVTKEKWVSYVGKDSLGRPNAPKEKAQKGRTVKVPS